jgi:nitroreductase
MSLYLAAERFGLSCEYLGPHAGPDLVARFDLPTDWRFTGLVTVGYRKPGEAKTTSARRGWENFDQVVRWV